MRPNCAAPTLPAPRDPGETGLTRASGLKQDFQECFGPLKKSDLEMYDLVYKTQDKIYCLLFLSKNLDKNFKLLTTNQFETII